MNIDDVNITENQKLVKQFIKVHILYMRYCNRHTAKNYHNFGQLEMIFTHNQPYMTYMEATKRLKEDILKLCKDNDYLVSSITELENQITKSEIATLRFGVEPKKKFTEEEYKLDNYKFRVTLYYIGTISIKEASEAFGIKPTTLKQACQQERLLNTEKIGQTWRVHIGEIRDYWNIKDDDVSHLYYNWEY